MRRSVQVSAPLLAAAALALVTGCRKPQMQRCVDEHDHVVPDSFCRNPPVAHDSGGKCIDDKNNLLPDAACQNAQSTTSHSPGLYLPMYRYYYGGFGSFDLGSTVSGGSYTAISGQSYSSSTTRGGFGSSGSSADEAGGHAGSGGE